MSKNYSGKLDIDVSGFNKALKEAKANLALAASEFKLAKEQGSAFESISDKLSRKLEALNKVYNESTNKTELLKKKYEILKNELGETNEKVINAKKAWIDSKTETEKLSNEISQYNKALEDNKEITDNCALCSENLCHALTAVEEVTIHIAEALAKKAAKALVDFTKETINTGKQFETSFTNVKKVVSGTEEDFKKLENEIRQMALEKPISADAISDLYKMGSQLGIQKDNLKDFTNTIVNLANTSDLTTEAGATMIAQFANVMNLPVEDYEKFASTLSYLGSTTATTESRIMDMAQRMSGAAASIGLSSKDVLALSTAMGSVGLSAESAGSAMSTIMLNIETAVAESSEKLNVWAETAGMTASEFSKLWKTDVVSAIQAVIKGLSDEKAGGESLILTLNELGINNIRQKSTMLQLANAGDLLTETIKKSNSEWEKHTFLTDSAAEAQKTLEAQTVILQNTFKELQLSIYDNLKQPLTEASRELTNFLKSDDAKKFANDFSQALSSVSKIAVGFIKFVISNFGEIVGLLKIAIPLITHLFVVSMVKKYKDSLNGLISGFKNLIPSIQNAIIGQTSLNAAMSANPIGAILTLISLLINGYMVLSGLLSTNTNEYEKQTNAITEETKALQEEKNALLENKATREENIAGIDAEYNHTQSLISELKTLVDENGNVKTGYEDRVNTIIPLLQNATGEEISLINNQIQGYDNLLLKLDEVIDKKRDEARINAYQGDYEEAIKGLDKNKKEKKKINDEYNDILNQIKELEKSGKAYSSHMERGDKIEKETKEYSALKKQKEEMEKQYRLYSDMDKEYKTTMQDYENLLSDFYTKYNNKTVTTEIEPKIDTQPKSNISEASTIKTDGASKTNKIKEKTENQLLKEGNYTYKELTNLQEKYGNDLKVYTEEMKKGNSEVTVAMVEETKKNLDTVESKIKSMKELLGTTPTNLMSTENDNTEEQLEAKKKILKNTLSQLGTEMKNGNTAITNEMLDQINKAIDQTDAKLQNLKNKYDTINSEDGEENEISEEINAGEKTGLTSSGVIYGAGVLDEKAIEDNATKRAQMEAEAHRQAEIALQEANQEALNERIKAQAQNEALAYQEATIDPSNLAIYEATEKYTAEAKQTAQAQGLNDNAYKVSDATTLTMNLAKNAAMQIDFSCIGLYICQGIVRGIQENKYMVIDAVKAMMEEANSAAEDAEEIGSPSKVFHRYGMWIDKGLANGIRDYASEVSDQVKHMAINLQNGVDGINFATKSNNLTNIPTLDNIGKKEVVYNFYQYNTSNKSLDTLAIYKESKSLLKRTVRDRYV